MCVCIFMRWKWSCRHVFYKEKIFVSTIRALILLILTRYKATFIIKFCRIFQCFRKRGFEPWWQAGPAKTITEPATSRALPHTQVLNGPSAQVSVTPTVQRQTEVTAVCLCTAELIVICSTERETWRNCYSVALCNCHHLLFGAGFSEIYYVSMFVFLNKALYPHFLHLTLV